MLAATLENGTPDTIDTLQEDATTFMAEQVFYLKMALARIQEEFDLPDDPNEVNGQPEWMDADMDALDAEIEAQKPDHLKSLPTPDAEPMETPLTRTAGRRKPTVVAGTEA